MRLESLLAELAVEFDPARERLLADARLLGDETALEALFEVEFDGLEFEFEGIAPGRFDRPARGPPRGARVVLLYRLVGLLWCLVVWFVHV